VIVGRAPARGWKLPALFAASVVAIFMAGMFLGRQSGMSSHARLVAASAQELSSPGAPQLRLAARVLVTQTRGQAPPTLPAPRAGDAVELLLDLHASNAVTKYSVELLRVSGNSLEPLGKVSGVATQGGMLSMFVRGSALTAGNYVIRAAAADGSEPLEFSLRVAGQAP
jgi:hypothetical protein